MIARHPSRFISRGRWGRKTLVPQLRSARGWDPDSKKVQPCTLCQINVTGTPDCGLVYLVLDDEELRAELAENRSGTPTPTP